MGQRHKMFSPFSISASGKIKTSIPLLLNKMLVWCWKTVEHPQDPQNTFYAYEKGGPNLHRLLHPSSYNPLNA